MAIGRSNGVLVLNWRDTAHPEGGGSEVYVEQLADGLAAHGRAVTMVCARYPGSPDREHRPSGAQIVRLGGRFTIYPRAAAGLPARPARRPADRHRGAERRAVPRPHLGPALARRSCWSTTSTASSGTSCCRRRWPGSAGGSSRGSRPGSTDAPSTWPCRSRPATSSARLGVPREHIAVVHNGTPPSDGPATARSAHATAAGRRPAGAAQAPRDRHRRAGRAGAAVPRPDARRRRSRLVGRAVA